MDNSPEFQARVDERRHKRMAQIDLLPADIKDLVHTYGFTLVNAYMACGVTKAKHIRHLVETTLDELSPVRGSAASQGTRAPRKGTSE